MPERIPLTVDLKKSQHEFLEGIVRQYALPDMGKAIRVLIEFAIHEPGLRDEVFSVVRCRDCS